MITKVLRYEGEADAPPLQYTACGLDDVYLLSGYERHNTRHGAGVSIKDVDELHRAIGQHLACDKKTLNGKEFRFLRKQMELTQAALAEMSGVTSQTVARWEKGENTIDGPAEALIRLLYMKHIDALPDEVLQFLQDLAAKDENPAMRQIFAKSSKGWVPLADCA